MIQNPPILITGTGRCGASMIAATVNLCGAFAGDLSKRDRYSNARIRETVIKPYLNKIRVDVEGQYPFPPKYIYIPSEWKCEVERIMIRQGYKEGPWMYKDSRIIWTWVIWNYYYPDAKWLFVRRKTSDIIQSCMKTAYMNAYKTDWILRKIGAANEEEGWLWWVHKYEEMMTDIMKSGVNYKEIWPERMVDGDYQQIKEVIEWLDLKWDDHALDYIDTLLWGSKYNKKE